jgi:phospholipid/cholesterol/gamma-HCH transport system ATP-binding protein
MLAASKVSGAIPLNEPSRIEQGEVAGVAPPVIETRGLAKRFGGFRVLDGVDLRIPEGSVCAIMGPSGTGKSVLIRHVLGLLRPDEGDVLVRGRSLRGMRRMELSELRRDIGVMFQDGALFSSMTVYENVAFPLRQHTDYRDSEVREIVMEQLNRVGLAPEASKYPSELSGGMKKRAGLARSLVLDPSILIADEPDSGLDPVRTALLGSLLAEQHADLGGTVIVITHNVMLAKQVSDFVCLLWRGKLIAAGPSEAMWTSGDEFVRQFLAGESRGPLGMD